VDKVGAMSRQMPEAEVRASFEGSYGPLLSDRLYAWCFGNPMPACEDGSNSVKWEEGISMI